jgi:hypothetical protein
LSRVEVKVVFVETPPDSRIARWGTEITRPEVTAVDSHPIEADLPRIRQRADVIIDTQTGAEDAFRTLIRWIVQENPSMLDIVRL